MAHLTRKVIFEGSLGDSLAARLDLPLGPVRAYALFAHCFTCSKDYFAPARISRVLADLGIAVLRFDFTGLGQSEGDFGNTNFSSNVQDLIAAAAFMRGEYEAPQLLIGHSLGGAAILSAAKHISEARAVATIGSPSDVSHIVESLGAEAEEVRRAGEREIEIGGRRFTLKAQFIEDAGAQNLAADLRALDKSLLIFHAPNDAVVDIGHAEQLFNNASFPKTMVTLEGADHLLSDHRDAIYVAEVLGAWAARYLETSVSSAPSLEEGVVLVRESGLGKFSQEIFSGRHVLAADEPQSFGGDDTGPSPYDYLAMALGACTSMTLRLYADRKGWPVERLSVALTHDKVHGVDCEDCDDEVRGSDAKVDHLTREIDISGDLDEDQRDALLAIADRCPVHRSLNAPVWIETRLK